MLKTIIKFAYEQEGRNTWEQILAHDTAQNLHILQGINNYYTLWTLQGWSYCRVLLQKWWETSKSNLTTNAKYYNFWVTQPTECSSHQIQYDYVSVQQIPMPMVTKQLSLTHLYKIYWLQGINHFYTHLLQSNKRLKWHVTLTISDMLKTRQNM